jgi:predicted RNA-binding protein with EMAP domain
VSFYNFGQDEKDRAQTELHHKFSSFREKYKTMKVTNRELQSVSYCYFSFDGMLKALQALDVLHHDLVEMTGQRDEAEDRVKTEEKVCVSAPCYIYG